MLLFPTFIHSLSFLDFSIFFASLTCIRVWAKKKTYILSTLSTYLLFLSNVPPWFSLLSVFFSCEPGCFLLLFSIGEVSHSPKYLSGTMSTSLIPPALWRACVPPALISKDKYPLFLFADNYEGFRLFLSPDTKLSRVFFLSVGMVVVLINWGIRWVRTVGDERGEYSQTRVLVS